LRRSHVNEYEITEKVLGRQEGGPKSPERIRKVLQKLPPFAGDAIPEEDISSF